MDINKKIDEGKDTVDSVSKFVSDKAQYATKHVKEYSDEVANRIKGSPWQSALIAGAIGLLIGKFL